MDRKHLPMNVKEKLNSRISLFASIIVLLIITGLLRFVDHTLFYTPPPPVQKETPDGTVTEPEPENITTSAHIVAVGNHIFDSRIYEAGKSNWNYSFLYGQVSDEIMAADCAIVSQETPLTTNHGALSGYPTYRSPAELTDGLIKAGFDVVASASCHADDAGSEGILETLEIWKNRYPHVPVLGIHDTAEDAGEVKVMNVNDIQIAFLNYTFGTYTGSLKSKESYMLDTFQKKSIVQAVTNAQMQSDCVIFIAHWGDTDTTAPTDYQTQWASFLMSLGVDVIIGTHPMCPQPYGTIQDELGHETTIFYSLGNFVCLEENPNRLLGAMASFTIEKNVENGRTTVKIKDRSAKPLVMHYDYERNIYCPYFLDKYTEDLAAHHSIIYSGSSISLDGLKYQYDALMSQTVTPANSISIVNSSDAPAYTVGEKDEFGGFFDEQGRYHDVSGLIFTDDGYYDLDNKFHEYE